MVTEMLAAARDLYESAPSHVGVPGVPVEGEYCMVTALYEVMYLYGTDTTSDAFLAIRNALPGEYTNMVDFNADHSTEEVLEVFDRAIRNTTLEVSA